MFLLYGRRRSSSGCRLRPGGDAAKEKRKTHTHTHTRRALSESLSLSLCVCVWSTQKTQNIGTIMCVGLCMCE